MSVYTAGVIIFLGLLVSMVYLAINDHPVLAAFVLLAVFSLRITDDEKKESKNERD